jgi:hypothetical protein
MKPKIKTTKAPLVKKRVTVKEPKAKKVFNGYKIMVRSRHPSHNPLRTLLPKLFFRTVVRLGSSWAGDGKPRVECNSVGAVKTSANKLLMKEAFVNSNVVTADWFTTNGNTMINKNGEATIMNLPDLPYPLVAKHIHGSRGTGNYLLKTQEELNAWLTGKTLNNYIFEKFYNYTREYRLHVTKNGCFYTCRKMLKEETPADKRWFRNDSNSVWIVEDNPAFDKPVNWNAIVNESVKALSSVGLDIGAIDVKVQSAKDKKGRVRPEPKFIILETNSAPSFGDVTLQKYLVEIPKVLREKKA